MIVPGDGLTLWTITHSSDFAKGLVGLLGHPGSIGHAFHITSDEALTWNQIYQMTAEAAGVAAACVPTMTGTLLGDKSNTAIFDNSKIKRFVPGFTATTRYRDGIARTIAWFDADPSRRTLDLESTQLWDRLIGAYNRGLEVAVKEFPSAKPPAR